MSTFCQWQILIIFSTCCLHIFINSIMAGQPVMKMFKSHKNDIFYCLIISFFMLQVLMSVEETGVGEMGVCEMGQIIGKTGVGEMGVGEMGVGETGTNPCFILNHNELIPFIDNIAVIQWITSCHK